MKQDGQSLTYRVYSDPSIIRGYMERHSDRRRMRKDIERFVASLPGKRVVDIGCGPVEDPYIFSEFGCRVVAIDYSEEMINAAKGLKKVDNPPLFLVGDMRDVGDMFEKNSFDGAWINASLLHIPEKDVPRVLQGVKKIVVPGGKIYIGLKAGVQGQRIVKEDKYGKDMEREFTFWEKKNFKKVAEKNGFVVEKVSEGKGHAYKGKASMWYKFYLMTSLSSS